MARKWVVQRVRQVATGEQNALGQPKVESATTDIAVYCWAPTQVRERQSAELAGRVIADIDLYVFTVDWLSTDAANLAGTEYEVVGIEDWNRGPTRRKPGGVVKLRRVSGA